MIKQGFTIDVLHYFSSEILATVIDESADREIREACLEIDTAKSHTHLLVSVDTINIELSN